MKKVKIKKKTFLTHSIGPQGNLKQLFCANSKDKMVRLWPTFKKY
jgi:hypothetical protein